MALGVPVPPGAAFDRYRYVPPPAGGGTVVKWTRILEVKYTPTGAVVYPLMRGPDVLYWQEGLIELGCLAAGQNDGKDGPITKAGTQKFQQKFMSVYPGSGRVGLNSWVALNRQLGL
jgi:peptidoglycan hydrolase-like protein with peptidoglycan-binding domain